MERRIESQNMNDGKKNNVLKKEERQKIMERRIDRIKNMDEKRQKKKIFCIIDLL